MSRFGWFLIVVTAFVIGCSSAPEAPLGPDGQPDPVLTVGRDIWVDRCARCQANDGRGRATRERS